IPGTTRDTIVESLSIGGLFVTLIDTAGVRNTGDLVESIGVERTIGAIDKADVVLWVIDASEPLTSYDYEIEDITRIKKRIIILNKIDIDRTIYINDVEQFGPVIEVSCKTGEGIDNLKLKLKDIIGDVPSPADIVPVNARHEGIIKRSLDNLSSVLEGLKCKYPLDVLAGELWESYNILREITGESVSIDIIEEIFSRFCVGK
ncbi:MAG: GTP-binding protein, partial [bacterium]